MKTNVICFGDSITYGEYDGVLGGWVEILKRYCHDKYTNHNAQEVNMFNQGIGGETTAGMIKRYEIELAARLSQGDNLLFFAYGANDLAEDNGNPQVDRNTFKANLTTAIINSQKMTNKIYLINILPMSDSIDGILAVSDKVRANTSVIAYNEVIKQVADETGVTYLDLYSQFMASDKEALISKDGIHPNETGYALMTEAIKPIVSAYL